MLVSLHVKNLALMEEAEVTFGDGLNIWFHQSCPGREGAKGNAARACGICFGGTDF